MPILLSLAEISHTVWWFALALVGLAALLAITFKLLVPESPSNKSGRRSGSGSSGSGSGSGRKRKRRSSSSGSGSPGGGSTALIGARGEARESQGRRQRESNRDYFKLDMSRYTEAPALVDKPTPSEDLHLAYWLQDVAAVENGGHAAPPPPEPAPRKPEFPAQLTPVRPARSGASSQRNFTVPVAMTRIMDMLKSNRRYEFGEMSNRQERLGAATSGGLFAEIQFGRSEDESVLQSGLNPD